MAGKRKESPIDLEQLINARFMTGPQRPPRPKKMRPEERPVTEVSMGI